MWIVCITSVRHVLTVNGYGGRQTKENEKSWCFKGWETLVYNSTGGKVFDSKRGVMAMSITTIDVSKLAAGYYTMEYQCNGCTMKQNFIKY